MVMNMDHRGVDLCNVHLLAQDRPALLDLIKSCGEQRDLCKARRLHSEILHRKLFPKEISIKNALLTMYVNCSAVREAQEVFDATHVRNVVTWSALISGLARHGHVEEALSSFRKMQEEGISPNEVTFVSALKSCSSISCLKMGEEIHVHIIKHGLIQDNVVLGNALIDMYAKCGMIGKAQEVFEELPVRNVVTWNVLITYYSHQDLASDVLICFDRMRDEGILPDVVTFICILKACGTLGFLEIGEEIHGKVDMCGFVEKNVVLGTAIVDMYARCGMLEKARQVLSEIPTRNTVAWSALISGYVLHGLGEEALACFEQMQNECFVPDSITFISILKACGITGYLHMGEEVHAQAETLGLLVEKDVVLGTALVDMYTKCGALGKAQEVFNKLLTRNVVSWNALLAGYTQVDGAEVVVGLFNQMMAEGVYPNAITCLALLKLCNHAGLVKEGKKLFSNIDKPTLDHYTCMVDLYCHAGCLDEALGVIEKVSSFYRLPLWLVFLTACHKCMNLELGRLAFEQTLQLDDRCASAYVCMANIYVS